MSLLDIGLEHLSSEDEKPLLPVASKTSSKESFKESFRKYCWGTTARNLLLEFEETVATTKQQPKRAKII